MEELFSVEKFPQYPSHENLLLDFEDFVEKKLSAIILLEIKNYAKLKMADYSILIMHVI